MTNRDAQAAERRAAGRAEFLLVFIIAAAGSLALPSIGPSWLLAIWGAAWMGIYLVVVRARWADYFETADFADSFYYLGFLLTLAALAGALVRLSDMNEDVFRAVLGQFGLALVTTIVGLTGRTILTMSGTTLAETEERAGRQIKRAFDDFTRSLKRLTAEADAFAGTFGEGLRQSLSRIEGEVDGFAMAATATKDRLVTVHEGLDFLGGVIHGTASEVQTSGQQLAGGLREIGETAGPRLAEIGTQLDGVLGKLRALARLLEEIGRGADTATRGTMERVETLAVELAASLETVVDATRSATSGVGDQALEITKIVAEWTGNARELAKVHKRLVEEADGSSQAVVDVRREIASAVEALIKELHPSTPAA